MRMCEVLWLLEVVTWFFDGVFGVLHFCYQLKKKKNSKFYSSRLLRFQNDDDDENGIFSLWLSVSVRVFFFTFSFACRVDLSVAGPFRWCRTGWCNFPREKYEYQHLHKTKPNCVSERCLLLPLTLLRRQIEVAFATIELLISYFFYHFVRYLNCRFFSWRCRPLFSPPFRGAIAFAMEMQWMAGKNSLPLRLWQMAWCVCWWCLCVYVYVLARTFVLQNALNRMHKCICIWFALLVLDCLYGLMRVLNCVLWWKITNCFRRRFSFRWAGIVVIGGKTFSCILVSTLRASFVHKFINSIFCCCCCFFFIFFSTFDDDGRVVVAEAAVHGFAGASIWRRYRCSIMCALCWNAHAIGNACAERGNKRNVCISESVKRAKNLFVIFV